MKTAQFLFGFSILLLLIAACASPTASPTATVALQASPTSAPTPSPIVTLTPDAFAEQRAALLADIRALGVEDPAALRAMEIVPRHKFVPADYQSLAYANRPLPIGYGQTISQPYIVALMTELAQLEPGDRVLEIGTGSGYQAAILATITDQVYSIEIIPELAVSASARLRELGFSRVTTKNADGYYGWPEFAPFDAILVTAAPDHVPPPLVAQLKDGGRLIIPVGPQGSYQTLWRITKRGEQVLSENIIDVTFVPLTGGPK